VHSGVALKSEVAMQCAAVFGSVLQCVAVCCSVLQCFAVCCSVFKCISVCCSVVVQSKLKVQCMSLSRSACCSMLQCIAACTVCSLYCSVLQCVAVCCSVLQCVVVSQNAYESLRCHGVRLSDFTVSQCAAAKCVGVC